MIRRLLLNNQIRAKEVRLIDETDKQLGLVPLEQALALAKERGLDLIQVTEKVVPPVCKLGDYGKYQYRQEKREKSLHKSKGGELKSIRLTFNISPHDLETKAKQAEKFLKNGDKVKLELFLRGRERGLEGFAKEKVVKFIEFLRTLTEIKVERELKKEPRGLMMIISKT